MIKAYIKPVDVRGRWRATTRSRIPVLEKYIIHSLIGFIINLCISGFDSPAHWHSGICPAETDLGTCRAPLHSLSPSRTSPSPCCTCPCLIHLCPHCTSQSSHLSLGCTSPKLGFHHTCPCLHLVLGVSKSHDDQVALSDSLLLVPGSTSCLGGRPPTASPANVCIQTWLHFYFLLTCVKKLFQGCFLIFLGQVGIQPMQFRLR